MISKMASLLVLVTLSTCKFVDRESVDIPYYPRLAEIPELEADKYATANAQRDLIILSDDADHAHSIKNNLKMNDMFTDN